ncbi:Na(+)/citrate cotransporter-like isoform X1 [Branchiostoma floridae x Branchiostoma belcheri]
MAKRTSICNVLLRHWKVIILLVTPVIFSPLPIHFSSTENSKIAACGYAVIIMAVYWASEALPLPVTGLLPIFLFPMLGIQSARDVSVNYAKDAIFLLIGSVMFAIAIERWNLHKRIALRVLLTVGVEPKRLMLGMMSATAFLSMWINNTATTAMMVPTVENITGGIPTDDESDPQEKHALMQKTDEKTGLLSAGASGRGAYRKPEDLVRIVEYDDAEDKTQDEPLFLNEESDGRSREQADRMAKGLLLCICYAANIGGIATLTGSSTNILAVEVIEALYPESKGIDFATWFFFGFPTMLLILIVAYIYLLWLFLDCSCLLGCRKRCREHWMRNQSSAAYLVVKKQYNELGPVSFAEKVVLFHFVLLVLLWFFRDMKFLHLENGQAAGWTYYFLRGYVTDASTVMMIIISLFFWPSRPPNFMCCRNREDTEASEPAPSILDWETVHQKMPWGLVFLIGGGYALADGIEVSGLSVLLSRLFKSASGFLPVTLVLIVTTLVAFVTELISNAPVAAIALPILANLAEGICIHPFHLLVPATIASAFAFMLPVASPPNAIVLQSDKIQLYDMVKSGFLLNIIGILVLNIAIGTYGFPLYGLDTLPPWAKAHRFCNNTLTTVATSTSALLNSTLVPDV